MNGDLSLEQLYERYLDNRLSEEELADFLLRLHHPENEERAAQLMDQTWEKMFTLKEGEARVVPFWKGDFFRIAAAAVVVLTIGMVAYFTFFNQAEKAEKAGVASQQERFKNDLHPGTNHAELILADGSKVNLDSAHKGSLAMEGTVEVTRLENGQIVYEAPLRQAQGDIRYNTIRNPRGSKVVSLTLSDGSKVWLDAASSITYPAAFTGRERKVEITGQAYFEVATDPLPTSPEGGGKRAFVVSKGDLEVAVLGTHFNVMAFDDEEDIQVTLLEGVVKVSRLTTHDSRLLKPGQQAVLTHDSRLTTQDAVDLDQTMAWKNGIFQFRDMTIEALMKQVARWYDVEVIFEDRPTEHFISTIPRDVPASQVFKILETTGRVHFRIEGKKVVVMK